MINYGRTSLPVSRLCVGTSSWGPLRDGETDEDRDARILEIATTVLRERPAGINFIDTSNEYGGSRSEGLIGRALQEVGGLPDDFVLQTKLDCDRTTRSFSAERMWESLEESKQRLGIKTVQVLFLHDPEFADFDELTGPGGAVEAMVQMRDEGQATWLGISGGYAPAIQRYLDLEVFDTLITHNRFTLLDRSAEPLLAKAAELGLGVTNAAPYGGGILTGDPRFADRYCYREASPAVRESAAAMAAICERAGVPLGAAALQFSLREERVHSTVVGVSTLAKLEQAINWSEHDIPDDLWEQLEAVAPAASDWLEPPR